MRKNKKPELLSPAGSMDSVRAAVENGCDAVYLGGRKFSARQYADNFGPEDLQKACDYCHLRGVKVYVTVNTLYKDSELPALLEFVGELWTMGVDALILQDLGAAAQVRKAFPDFPLHASTQACANSLEDVNFLAGSGFATVILSRELSLPEIRTITAATDTRIEVFVHGALCVSYSGQCLMSSFLGGRSGNRGRCAQPCRLPYQLYHGPEHLTEGYLLSPKDMNALPLLPELLAAGVDSLKIEGRMKSHAYVAGVTRIYRKYLDLAAESPENYAIAEADEKELLQLFNRGGFSEGYFHTHSGRDMMSPERPKTWGLLVGHVDRYIAKAGRVDIRTREALAPGDGVEVWTKNEPHPGGGVDKASRPGQVINLRLEGNIRPNDPVYRTFDKTLTDELTRTYEKDLRKLPVRGELTLRVGKAAGLSLWTEAGVLAHVTGEPVTAAQKRPLTQETALAQLGRLGDTPFALTELLMTGDEEAFLPMSALNALRRAAAEALEAGILKKSRRGSRPLPVPEAVPEPVAREKKLSARVRTQAQMEAALAAEAVETVYFQLTPELTARFTQNLASAHAAGKRLFAMAPRIWRNETAERYAKAVAACEKADGWLAASPGAFAHFAPQGPVHVDFPANVFNRSTVEFWKKAGAERICLSPELTLEEIGTAADGACDLVGYGRLPLMVTTQCPIGNYAGGKTQGPHCTLTNQTEGYFLKDRKGEGMTLLTDCADCVCTILNPRPLYLGKALAQVRETPAGGLTLVFTVEDGAQTAAVLRAYTGCAAPEELVRPATKGHYFHGVE